MTTKQLTVVAFQVFAIYLLVKAIMMLPLFASGVGLSAVSTQALGRATMLWVLGLASMIVLAVLAILIWRLSSRIVAKAQVQAQAEDDERFRITEAFLLALLGVYFVVEGIQAFGLTMWNSLAVAQHTQDLTIQSYSYIAAAFFEFVVGLSLVLRASGWANLLRRLRTAGLKD
ncbi:MAG: hypothetical protein AAGA23_12105 [Pseudomonadota bacterium]